MRKTLLVLIFGMIAFTGFSQSLPDFDAIPLEKKEDFNSTANDAALQAAKFLFSTPVEKDNLDRLRCTQYVIKWMSGSPDYHFVLDEKAVRFAKKNTDLLALYMAAMTKFVLENKSDAEDQDKIKLHAVKMIVDYAKDEKNNVKLNAELKKAIKADENGELAKYVGI